MIFQQSFPPYTPPFEPPQPPTPSPPQPISLPPLEPVIQPLRWLWPGHIPSGKLTLLDGSPNCGTTLFAITLAAHISTGRPFPDGSPCPQGNVLFLTPYDNECDTILPRLKAAGADEGRVISFSPVDDPTPTDPRRTRPFLLAQDLALLESTIISMEIILLILDPYTAFPGWHRALPALIELAARTHCAIVFTRSLSRAPSDLLHPHCSASPVLTAARSHLLLAPDPRDERHCLLLTPKHPLCPAPPLLAYTITSTQDDPPLLQWLPAPDPAQLHRLATGPLRSPQRQAILRFLHQQPAACPLHTILEATSYDYAAGRKMLLRMSHAGELVSLDRGLYTTTDHPCLTNTTPDTSSPVPNVPSVPAVPDDSSTSIEANNDAPTRSDTLKASPIYRPQAWAEELSELLARVRSSTSRSQPFSSPMSHVPTTTHLKLYRPLISQPFHLPFPSARLSPQPAIPMTQINVELVPNIPAGSEPSGVTSHAL